jgi:hypothetical protein
VLDELASATIRCSSWRLALEKIALEEHYFVSAQAAIHRRLLFGIVQKAIAIPVQLFTGDFRGRAYRGLESAQLTELGRRHPEYKISGPGPAVRRRDAPCSVPPLVKR